MKEAAEWTSSVDATMAALWEEDPTIYIAHAATVWSNLASVMPHPVTQPAELDSFLPLFDEHFNFRMDTKAVHHFCWEGWDRKDKHLLSLRGLYLFRIAISSSLSM